jgi:hypothetical protein
MTPARLAEIKAVFEKRGGMTHTDGADLIEALEEMTRQAENWEAEALVRAKNTAFAQEQRDKARTAVGLLNSMVLSGESHSEISRAAVRAATED